MLGREGEPRAAVVSNGAGPWSVELTSHLQRVSGYAALVAGRLGLDAELIRVAARLHDVGMVGVADGVLFKPGPLTAEERRDMQDHTHVGRAMLEGSGTPLLDTAAEIAWSHHERFDGQGYPNGFAGEQIPLSARITTVADAFDAITTDRVYRRPAPGLEAALETLRSERERQFDPAVVDAFLSALEDVLAIRERFAPADEGRAGDDDALITLQAAANALGITPSRLRRWADEGRIPSVRTAGGHRRFPLRAVHRLAARRGVRPRVRGIEPPETPLPTLAAIVGRQGERLAATAATAVYREGAPGWFASETAMPDLREWLEAVAKSAAGGRYAAAVQATEALMRRAQLNTATVLERHAFLERFGQIAVRALARADAARRELTGTRRLFAALQQALLESCG